MSVLKKTDVTRRRSQRFPSYSLREVCNRLQMLHEKEKGHAIDRDTASRAMGFSSSVNGSAGRMLSTLQLFGLVESTGRGMIRVTPLGLKYLRPVKDSDKLEAIVEAFRCPTLYGEVIAEYGDDLADMPSETTLRNWLIRSSKLLTKDSAQQFVTAFIDSARFKDEHQTEDSSCPQSAYDAEPASDSSVCDAQVSETVPAQKRPVTISAPLHEGFTLSSTLSATMTVALSASGATSKRELKLLKTWLETIATPSVMLAIQSCEEEVEV